MTRSLELRMVTSNENKIYLSANYGSKGTPFYSLGIQIGETDFTTAYLTLSDLQALAANLILLTELADLRETDPKRA